MAVNHTTVKKKVCMLGTLSVGKTSLVRRYVHSMFSDAYKTTIGVKVDTKKVQVADTRLNLVLWDMEGADKFQDLRQGHLRGAAGYLLVVDGTRPNSLQHALAIREQVVRLLPDVPGQVVFNKCDRADEWCLDTELVQSLSREEHPPIHTSAMTGENVEEMFQRLAQRMLEPAHRRYSA